MNKPDYEQNLAAIRGEQLPDNLSSEEGRTSIIRGIRHHHGFATSAAVTALSAEHAHFARARNARLIMSNIVPEPEEMDGSERERGSPTASGTRTSRAKPPAANWRAGIPLCGTRWGTRAPLPVSLGCMRSSTCYLTL